MANQKENETDSIVSFVKRAVKLTDDSTTLMEQLTCFLCCYVLFPDFSLSIWCAYFELTVLCTFFALDEVNVSRDDWKEKCSFKKFGIMIGCLIVDELGYETGDLFDNLRDIFKRKAPCLLGLYDLVVGPNGSEPVYKFQEAAAEEEEEDTDDDDDLVSDDESSVEDSDDDEEENSNFEKQSELLILISTVCNLKCLLNESKGLETELRAQNANLYEKLYASEAKCNQLHNSLMESFASNQELEDQVAELMEDKSALFDEIHSIPINEIDMAEQHKLQIFNLNKTIEELGFQNKQLVMLCTTEARNAEYFRALSSEYEEQNKIMETRLKKTIQELESDKDDILARLSIEASNAEHFRALSTKTIQELKTEEHNHKVTSEFLTQYELENDELHETISELKDEKDELTAELTNALSTIEHFQAESSEYKDANESLEQEKGMLLVSLQKANESAEFHKKLLDLEYAIV